MGQNQSKFDSPKKSRNQLKAPSEWRNDAEFEVVSPMSDISNPSQFRGRQINHTHSVHRSRASKVCPKQKPSTGIPAPSRFYFQNVESDTNENIAPSQDSKPAWLKSVKDKCSKAKNQLSDCFIQKEDENILEKNIGGRYRVDEEPPKKATRTSKPKNQPHNEYLQFKPALKQNQCDGPTDDVYLQHFMASLDEPEKAPTDATHSTLKGRALSLESSKGLQSQGSSRHQSLESTSKENSTEPSSNAANGIFRRNEGGSAPILRTQTSESMRLRASISKTESIDQNDQRRASVGQKVQEQINQKAGKVTRVQRLQQQYQEELQRISAGGAGKNVENDRYAVSVENRSSSVPKQLSVEHQDNIKRTDSTTEVLMIQGLNKKEPTLPNHRSTSVPKRLSVGHEKSTRHKSNAPKLNESKKKELKKESKKGESKKGQNDDAKAKCKGRRSVSAPRCRNDGRPSIDGSALLHLAGLKAPTAKPSQPMPALLKIAGWQSKESEPQRPSLKENKQKATRHLVKSNENRVQEEAEKVKKPSVKREKADKDQKKQKTATSSKEILTKEKKRSKKKTRFSDPLPFAQPSDNGKTIATILQQAYFGDMRDKDEQASAVNNSRGAPQLNISKSDSLLFSPSTVASGSPKPSIYDEADTNAHFLFTADENNVRVLPTKPTSSCSISTLESRSRMHVHYEAAEIPPPTSSTQAIDSEGYRHVRFSDDSKTLNVPGIDSKYSDLTESTSGRESSAAMSIPRIDSIPEEEEEEEEIEPQQKSPIIGLYRSPEPTIFDEKVVDTTASDSPASCEETMKIDTDQGPEDATNDEETPKVPISRWSYRRDGSLSTGVTPLIDGRNHANLVTNSPYLRFQEAKEHFNGGKGKKIVPKKKDSPVKRKSPSKRAASLVTTRVAAMEAKTGLPKRPRRATTGRDVLAPRHSNLKSPSLVRTIQTKNLSHGGRKAVEITHQSSTPMSSVVSDSSTEDEFGRILHSNIIDEDSDDEHISPKVSDCEESVDEFDNILNCDESDEEESLAQPSVATLRARFSIESGTSSITEPASVATTLQRRRLVDAMSVISSTSSVGDTASYSSTIFSKAENDVPSAVQRMNAKNLPFRDVSSVKPNELSQGTPLQARKWRAYAAAAREKSLSVRNLNMQ